MISVGARYSELHVLELAGRRARLSFMRNLGSPNLQQRLHVIAAHLHLVYSDTPLTNSDAFAAPMRRLYALDSNDDKRTLPSVRQMCAGIKPDYSVEFIIVCPACGQMFDCRDEVQVEHHSRERHGPKLH